MTPQSNQNPEQIAPDLIDAYLAQGGWVVKSKNEIIPTLSFLNIAQWKYFALKGNGKNP